MEGESLLDKKTILAASKVKGIINQDHACKDYFQEIMLLAISREYPELIFKGGTCLTKFYGLDRFSEDLDLNGEFDDRGSERIGRYLDNFGYDNSVQTRKMKTGYLSIFKVRGFLYNGEDVSMTRVRLDVTTKDITALTPLPKTYRSLYPDIPSFILLTMDPREIISEKVRALFQRSRSRDLYDLDFLLGKGIQVDADLILEKLKRYDIGPLEKDLIGSLKRIERSWDIEMGPTLGRVPSFLETRDRVLVRIMAEGILR